MIKFFDLNRHDRPIQEKIIQRIKKIVRQKNFINGKEVYEFEKKFSTFINGKFSIACSNGTDALTIALKSLNLKKNSEVIIPAMTYVSTAFAVINANLKPVLVDIDLKTGLMSIEKLKEKISKQTKVIMPVHLYGNVFDVNKLNLSKKIFIIDDASQAHGAKYLNGKYVGTSTHASCFSLYPGKNLGAYGDAGIITTQRKKYKNLIIKYSNLGSDRKNKYNHDVVGNNNRLDTIQASILIEKIAFLKKNNVLRNKIAKLYLRLIKNKKIKLLHYSKYSVFHQFIILTKNRNEFMNFMFKNKIQTGIHYPKAIHQHLSIKKLFSKKKFPNATKFAKECVSIPIDPYLNKNEIDYIINKINSY